MNDTDVNRQEHTNGRNLIFLLLGFTLLGLAAALILFGSRLFDGQAAGANEPESVLDQVEPLEISTPVVAQPDFSGGSGPAVGEMAPAFTLNSVSGESVSLNDFQGRPIIINFWATWCAPCILEMPELQAAFERHEDDGLVILALNRDEDLPTIEHFYAEELDVTITFLTLLDEEAVVANQYGILNMPTTYFVNPEGEITAVHRGPLAEQQIESYLAQTLAPSG